MKSEGEGNDAEAERGGNKKRGGRKPSLRERSEGEGKNDRKGKERGFGTGGWEQGEDGARTSREYIAKGAHWLSPELTKARQDLWP